MKSTESAKARVYKKAELDNIISIELTTNK